MKNLIKKVLNYYNSNTYFHSFVLAIEAAVISFATAYNGGIPASKSAWVGLACAFGGALWGACKRWLASNVATKAVPVQGKQLTAVKLPSGEVSAKITEVPK